MSLATRQDVADGLAAADLAILVEQQSRLLERLVSGSQLATVLADLVEVVEGLLPGSFCSVLLADPAGTLHHGAAPSLAPEYVAAIDGLRVGPSSGSCGTAAYRRAAVIVEDIALDPLWDDFRSLALRHGLRSCWSTPILAGGDLLGTFAIYRRLPSTPAPRDLELIARVTHLAAIAIQHHRWYGAVTEGEERFRRAFDDNAVGMALLDPAGRYLRVNDALAALVGRPFDELSCGSFRDVLHPDDVEGALADLDGLRHDDRGARLAVERFVRPDTTVVWVATTTTLVHDAEGRILCLCQNVVDITATRQAEADREARRAAEVAQAAAEAASRAKSDFLAELSHELRTPLSSIVGYTELLSDGGLSREREASALEAISESAQLIRALVDGLLDLARIERGIAKVDARPVALAELLADVTLMLRPLAEAHRVVLIAPEPAAGDPLALADPVKLRQVVLNLASNAIKYNRPGGRVDLEIAALSADEVAIRVHDTGVGIPAAAGNQLFEPFARFAADATTTDGFGLGLAVSRRLIEAMGGRIEVDSRIGEGSTFTVALRVA